MRKINSEFTEEKGYKKAQILYVLHVLENETDEKHTLSQAEIALKVKGLRGEITEEELSRSLGGLKKSKKSNLKRTETKSIGSDLRILKDVGYDVRGINMTGDDDKIRQNTRGHIWLKKEIGDEKLQVLIDTVLFASYLDKAEAKDLIDSLIALGSPTLKGKKSAATRVDGGKVYHPEKSNFFDALQKINESMEYDDPRRISFDYAQYKYNEKGSRMELAKVSEHIVSPYHYVVQNGRYYLVGYNHKKECLWHYRLDCIQNVEVLKAFATERDKTGLKGKTIGEYVGQHPYMFAGNPISLEVRISTTRLKILQDTFGGNNYGKGPIRLRDEGDYEVYKVTCTENEAFLFAMQYGSHVEVLSPQPLRDRIRAHVESMMFNYQSGDGDRYTEAIRFAKRRQVLNLEGIDLKDKTKHLSLKNVTRVRLSNNNITSVDFLANMPFLKSVSIKNNAVTDLSVLSNCKNLEDLQLENLKVDNVNAIKDLPITNLYLGLGKTEDLSAVQHLPKLKYLKVTEECSYNDSICEIWEKLEKSGVKLQVVERDYDNVNTNNGTFLNAYYPYNLMKEIFGRAHDWVGTLDDITAEMDKLIDKFSGKEKEYLTLIYKQRVSNMDARKMLKISIDEFFSLKKSIDKKLCNSQYVGELEKFVSEVDFQRNEKIENVFERLKEISKKSNN